jgi:hypothetical protein
MRTESFPFARRRSRARRDDILAVWWKNGPALFIRHAVGATVAQEIALISDASHSDELADCDALFEVSFLDADEVLNESISLPDLQWMFAKELSGGFEYLEWNRTLTRFDESY